MNVAVLLRRGLGDRRRHLKEEEVGNFARKVFVRRFERRGEDSFAVRGRRARGHRDSVDRHAKRRAGGGHRVPHFLPLVRQSQTQLSHAVLERRQRKFAALERSAVHGGGVEHVAGVADKIDERGALRLVEREGDVQRADACREGADRAAFAVRIERLRCSRRGRSDGIARRHGHVVGRVDSQGEGLGRGSFELQRYVAVRQGIGLAVRLDKDAVRADAVDMHGARSERGLALKGQIAVVLHRERKGVVAGEILFERELLAVDEHFEAARLVARLQDERAVDDGARIEQQLFAVPIDGSSAARGQNELFDIFGQRGDGDAEHKRVARAEHRRDADDDESDDERRGRTPFHLICPTRRRRRCLSR